MHGDDVGVLEGRRQIGFPDEPLPELLVAGNIGTQDLQGVFAGQAWVPYQIDLARAAAFISRTMELAPFRKILYSSDAVRAPELHFLGARLWRDGTTEVLTDFVERGQWSLDDACRVAGLIGRDNAIRLYRI